MKSNNFRVLTIHAIMLLAIFAGAKSRPALQNKGNENKGNEEGLDSARPEVQKTFYVGTFFKANWHTASKYCRHRGMLLASINSEREQHDLEATIDKYGTLDVDYLWLSGTNLNETNVYVWNNSRFKTPMTYTKWHTGHPTGSASQGFCVRLHQGKGGYGWSNYDCTNNHYFVCEISDFSAYSEHCLDKHYL